MTLAKVFRHNEVEGTSDCFLCRVTEDPLGAAVPKPDQTPEIRVNDRVGSVMAQSPTEAIEVESYIVGSRHNATFLFDAAPIEPAAQVNICRKAISPACQAML
jgi:hypothetical protein